MLEFNKRKFNSSNSESSLSIQTILQSKYKSYKISKKSEVFFTDLIN